MPPKAEKTEAEPVLVAAAKTIGGIAGKIAALAGAEAPATASSTKPAKFVKTGKSRLPRKLKKAEKKKAGIA